MTIPFRCYAHRGASAYAPENTAPAFDQAVAMGADAIETDVQITSDGCLVLHHDDTLARTTTGAGRVNEHTLADLRALDAGSWFGEAYIGTRMLTLREAMDEWLTRIPFALEIKDPAATDALIAEPIDWSRVEITSFDWHAIVRARQLGQAIRFGFLARAFDEPTIDRCVGAGLTQICPHADDVTADLVALAHARGLDVRAWGVSRPEQVQHLVTCGADGTTTNWPDWVRRH
jgi:glycerophosphoryl diester phosphodiesterase